MMKSALAALALLIVPQAAAAEQPLLHLVQQGGAYDVVQSDYDVAGVTLGMQPAIAFSELESRGYVRDPEGIGTARGPSFDELVQIEGGTLSEGGARSSWHEATFRKGDEGVHIRFKPLPTGTAAHTIVYVNTAPAMTFERFLNAASGKYGKPAFADTVKARWSDRPLIADEFDVNGGAIVLEARGGASQHGAGTFQQVKSSLTLRGGRVGAIDPAEAARDWTPEPKTTF